MSHVTDLMALFVGEKIGEGQSRQVHLYGLRSVADIKRLPEATRRVIVGWGWDRNGNFTVKLADKSKALDQLARHLGLYNDKVEISTTDKLADRMERAARRMTPPLRNSSFHGSAFSLLSSFKK